MSENNFVDGMFFNRNENVPEFVLGSIAIVPEKFIEWLNQQVPDEKGYIRMVVKKAKETGKPYVSLDTWKPEKKSEEVPF